MAVAAAVLDLQLHAKRGLALHPPLDPVRTAREPKRPTVPGTRAPDGRNLWIPDLMPRTFAHVHTDTGALQERLRVLTDFETVAARRADFFTAVADTSSMDDLVPKVCERFKISPSSAALLLEMPVRQWCAEGVQRRSAEAAELRARLSI